MKIAAGLFLLFFCVEPLPAQWVQVSGPLGGEVNCLAASGSNILVGTETGGAFRSTDKGASWAPINTGLTSTSIMSLAFSGTDLLAGTRTDGIFLSTDSGATWGAKNTGIPDDYCIDVLSFSVIGEDIFVSVSEGEACGTTVYPIGAFQTANFDSAWVALDLGLGEYYVTSRFVFIDSTLVTAAGGIRGAGYLYSSTDNGQRWKTDSSIIPLYPIASIVAVPSSEGEWRILVAGPSGVVSTTNLGLDWFEAIEGLTDVNVHALAAFGTNVLAGTSSGVFLSVNGGTSWTSITSDLTNTNISALVVTDADIFVGAGENIWRRPLAGIVTVMREHIVEGPNVFDLHQNFPNPFNGQTNFGFRIAEREMVNIRIFDLLGREVAVLVHAEMAAGVYNVPWDASEMPSGVYFCRFQAGAFTEMKKVALSR